MSARAANARRMLELGEVLPRVVIADDTGALVNTEKFLGRPLVLWFYPKDDTPG